jgi:hypothetical protein
MKFLIALVFYVVLLSVVSVEFGLIQESWTTPPVPESPVSDAGGGFWGQVGAAIQSALAPLRYVYNTVVAVLALMTYNVNGIPTLINIILITPVQLAILWLVIRLDRGGG